MKRTKHFEQRIRQRSISELEIDYARMHGENYANGRIVLSRKKAEKLMQEMRRISHIPHSVIPYDEKDHKVPNVLFHPGSVGILLYFLGFCKYWKSESQTVFMIPDMSGTCSSLVCL